MRLFNLKAIFIAFFLISQLCGRSVFAGPSVGGKIEFSEMTFDFGNVTRGQKMTHRFDFENIGDAVLAITGVHASCGCTVTHYETDKKYSPGNSGWIDVSFDTSNFVGPVVKSITVMTTERLMPTRNLTLKATIMSEFELDPPVLDFGKVRVGDSATLASKVASSLHDGKKIIGLKFESNLLESSFAENDKGGGVLSVKLLPQMQSGFIKEKVILQTNSSFLPEVNVLVRAEVIGNISLSPNYIEFGAIGKHATSQREIKLDSAERVAIKDLIAEINLNGRRIENPSEIIKIERFSDDRRIVATLINGAESSGSVHGRINVLTNDPSQNRISVDFYAFFKN